MSASDTRVIADRPSFDSSDFRHWIAFGFGTGLSPWAPGTMGTLAAIPLYLILSVLPITLYWIVVGIMFVVGIWICGTVAAEHESDDPGFIVWDEIVGFLVAMAAAPAGLVWVIAGFLLFRLIDITKPWPIAGLEKRFRGGFGIMLDDLVAGAMTWVVLQGLAMIVVASLRSAH